MQWLTGFKGLVNVSHIWVKWTFERTELIISKAIIVKCNPMLLVVCYVDWKIVIGNAEFHSPLLSSSRSSSKLEISRGPDYKEQSADGEHMSLYSDDSYESGGDEHNDYVDSDHCDNDESDSDDRLHDEEDDGLGNEPWEMGHIEDFTNIDTVEDIKLLDFDRLGPLELSKFDFPSVEIAYKFYVRYARVKGFGVRKSNKLKNKEGVVTGQTFVCNREGEREDRGLRVEERKRKEKALTRCGCKAMFRVHVDVYSGRWQARGFEKIGFRKQDIYNQIGRQRRLKGSDGSCALNYLNNLQFKETMKGKFPSSIITDGDIAMRNAIKRLYLYAMRYREAEFDFASTYGEPVLQTNFHALEKSAANVLTRDLFYLFQPVLVKSSVMWTKGAKSAIQGIVSANPCVWDIGLLSRYVSLLDIYMQLARVGSKRLHRYNSLKEKALAEHAAINDNNEESSDGDGPGEGPSMQVGHGCLNDPPVVRSKGSRNLHVSKTILRSKRPRKCRLCNVVGHNRATCPFRTQLNEMYGGSTAMIPDNGSFSNDDVHAGVGATWEENGDDVILSSNRRFVRRRHHSHIHR
ncbi:FAR1 DNA-binding domain [Sesbania bispinosa]|nr:FAR1 DNA-binding domain [Sesbania bispinosa]